MLASVKTDENYNFQSDSGMVAGDTLASQLTATLRDAIITGEMPQGSKVSEAQLSREMNVSRGPLREAIRRLEGMKLVHHVPQHGSRVVSLSVDLVLDIFHTREALESKAAAQAAMNMNSAEIDGMHRLLDTQSKQSKESSMAAVSAESDYAFHESLIRGSKNRVLILLLLDEIYHLIKMFRYQNPQLRMSSTHALTEHRQIIYAIEQRDSVLAEVMMRQHIVHARKRLQERLKKYKEPSNRLDS